ncbi:MAG: Asp-tRNA(Asn)/Glu-tRNA(Gln) amidotransferase subunit GatA [Bacteroidetes bacterium]|nr:MAG: Asp-tRNA(Asn)/Glu-tRNA(Gln) amidotransferase subunit GatA [Bacteroidota bacterium]
MYQYKDVEQLHIDLKSQTVTCVTLVNQYIERILQKQNLNIFLEVFEKSALEQAKQIDEEISKGIFKPLSGLIVSIKDNLCYKDHECTAASKILKGFVSTYTATAVQRLIDNGAIIIGRTNCDEFAMGSSNENSAYGVVKNPLNENYVAGGSSGGAAASLAAHLCMAALGSDTGGSVRQPASLCGVWGLKPTYGRISRWGLIAYASSFDQIGTFTYNAEDAAKILSVIAGADEYDATCAEIPVPDYTHELNQYKKQSFKIAYFPQVIESEGLNPVIKNRILSVIDQMQKQGHIVEPVEFRLLEYLIPTYYVLTTAEASSNLSRYDGVRYGYRYKEAGNLEEMYKKTRSYGFGTEVKRRILLGTFVLSVGYYDAYYTKAQKVRRVLYNAVKDVFKNYDAILMPTTPSSAFKIGDKTDDPLKLYLEDIYTVLANIVGIPAISIPAGYTENQMPFGIQVLTDSFTEGKLLAISKNIAELK